MYSRLKFLQSFCHLGNRTRLNSCTSDASFVFGWVRLLSNSFVTLSKPFEGGAHPNVTEPAKLPDSLKSSSLYRYAARKFSDRDDFVPPALAKWMAEYDVCPPDMDPGTRPGNTSISEVEQICKTLKNQFESPDAVVESLTSCSVEVTDDLVRQILERFCFEWIPCLGFFKWAKSQRGFKFSPELYDMMIDNMGKCKRFDLMFELLEEMKQLDGCISKLTMRIAMRRLTRAGKYHDAVDLFRNFERFGLPKDVRALNILLEVLVQNKGVELAEKYFTEFKQIISPNLYTFNILVNGWCKAKKIEKAEETVSEMERHGFRPDPVTWNCFIEAYCSENNFDKVDEVFSFMEKNGLVPSVVTHTIVVTGLWKAKKVSKALQWYDMMKQRGHGLDSSFYRALIKALSKSRRWNDARKVFEDMAEQGVKPDTLTYNAMIAAAVLDSREEFALTMLKEMEENQCKPDLATYTPLLQMCVRKQRMKVLSFLLSHMFRNNVSLDLMAYTILIRGLCMNGDLDSVCSFFEECLKKDLVPDDPTCDRMLNRLDKEGMFEEKVRIEELMQQAKLQKSVHSSNSPFRLQE